jgi:hypothetical protein
LRAILRKAIPDETRGPSNKHVKEFVCLVCAMARSKAPPSSSAHPTTLHDTYQPGEFLYIDGSGAYKFRTLDQSTQHLIVADHASHARFAFPTVDKKAVTVLNEIKKLQSHWGTKITKLRMDGEFSRTLEFQTWASANDVAIQETPPYTHQANGAAERAHGLIQDLARVQKIQSGAHDLLWPYSVRYAAKIRNRKPTSADPNNRTPLQLCSKIPFQHTQLETPPWGCLMFGHVGQRTDRSTAAAARTTPDVFVGTEDNSPSYLMYNIDTQKVSKVSYATFDIHKFPLKLMLLAGQPVPPDFPTCSDTYR